MSDITDEKHASTALGFKLGGLGELRGGDDLGSLPKTMFGFTSSPTSSGLPLPSAPDISGSVKPPRITTLRRASNASTVSLSDRKRNDYIEQTNAAPITVDDTDVSATERAAQDVLIKQFYIKFAKLQFAADASVFDERFGPKFALDRQRFAALEQSTESAGGSGKYLWVTINPDFTGRVSQAHLDTFQKYLDRLFTFTWIKSFKLCFEQRAPYPEEWKGLHVHMLIDRGTYVPSHAQRDLERVFLPICGNEKHIYCMKIDESLRLQKIRYMEGHKPAAKMPLVQNDAEMRVALGLKSIYDRENWNLETSTPKRIDEKSDEEQEEGSEESDTGSVESLN